MRAPAFAFVLAAFLIGLSPARPHAEEEKKDEVSAPQSVKDALKTLFPDGEVKSVKREQKGKLRRYNAEVQDKDGLHKLQMRADGSVLERTDPLKAEAIPAGIAAALKNKSSKAKATGGTKYTVRGKVTYEVEYENEGAKSKGYFAEDGSEAPAPAAAKDDDEDK
ncbi:MAG: hypothetical protein KIS92_15905 [Planctomycetota bacterium]|nr:hypothetical protein [Planctomycetota bacterium]